MDQIEEWQRRLEEMLARMGPVFANRCGRDRLALYIRGLLGNVERKNSWQLAEEAGEDTPYAMQQFLYRGRWDPDALARETRCYVIEQLGDREGVLVIDETGFLKKGRHSVRVQRQYSGTAGRVENCQIGVFLGYVSQRGRALLDRELYLPKSWTDDRQRCDKVGVPETVGFRTKPELARSMLQRALAEGVPARWTVGDSVYGDKGGVREWLEAQPTGYVLGTSVNDAHVPIGLSFRPLRDVIADLPESNWQRLSAGEGSQGPRWYDWQLVALSTFPRRGWRRGLLIQRSITDPAELKVHRCYYPDGTELATLVHVAGCHWTIETDIEEAKGEAGLDDYEVRSWSGWYRHTTLSCLAHVYLAVTKSAGDAAHRAAKKGDEPPSQNDDGGLQGQPGALVPLSVPEIRRLLCRLILTIVRPMDGVLAWSRWRRRHQAVPRYYHIRRRHARLESCLQL